jgi:tetratricopeptide (TPR) repeat protein
MVARSFGGKFRGKGLHGRARECRMSIPQDSESTAFRYRAFISYSHQDKAWADWLHKALEGYAIPQRLVGQATAAGVIPKRLTPIFRDRDELASAHDLGGKVNEALAQSANLIVICSPRAATSRWVNEEVLSFKRLGRSERIFCLIVDGEPNASDLPGRETEECFAPALRFQLDTDGQPGGEHTEPIAADARPGKDGKGNAKLKLVAGMLDVGFDALKQRELQRRIRRLSAIAALAVVVMAITTTLAIAALISRHAAEVARADAERRQKQAEDLVGFMLGDLNDKLKQVGRLDIMQAVDDKALAYFATLPTADATDSALALRVTALEKIGGVRMDKGATPAALQAYQSASSLAAELARRAPRDPMREATYGDSLKWVGQAYWYQGDLDQALIHFEAATTALRKAVSARADDPDLAFKLAATISNAGHVLEARGDFANAASRYQSALKIFEDLRLREPTNRTWQMYVAASYNNLGKLAMEQGRLDQAIANYRADHDIKALVAARHPNDRDAQESLLVSNAILGRTLGWCGETEAAYQYTRAAVTSAEALTQFDPTNGNWQDYFGLYSQQLGNLLRQRGQFDNAAAVNGTAVGVLNTLAQKDPTNGDWPPDLAQAQLESARLQLARHDIQSAQSAAAAAPDMIRQLLLKSPENRSLTLLLAQTDIVLGRIAAQQNDMTTAKHLWERARDLLAPTLGTGTDPTLLAPYAEALLRLDRMDAARPLIAQLNKMGYRTPDFIELLASKRIDYPVNITFKQEIARIMQAHVSSALAQPGAARPELVPRAPGEGGGVPDKGG